MAQKDVPDWFSFYPYEFIGDEHVIAMTLAERGVYITLLCRQWANGSIPADLSSLARTLKVPLGEMEEMWPAIAPCFPAHPETAGRLANARLERERKVTMSRMAGSSKGGKTSAERRRKLTASQLEASLELGSSQQAVNPYVMSCISSKESKKESVEKNIAEWEEFKRLYPKHRFDEVKAGFAWAAVDDPDAILDGLKAWLPSESWRDAGGKYVNAASRFISEGVYKMRPQAEEPEAPSRYQEWDGKS